MYEPAKALVFADENASFKGLLIALTQLSGAKWSCNSSLRTLQCNLPECFSCPEANFQLTFTRNISSDLPDFVWHTSVKLRACRAFASM